MGQGRYFQARSSRDVTWAQEQVEQRSGREKESLYPDFCLRDQEDGSGPSLPCACGAVPFWEPVCWASFWLGAQEASPGLTQALDALILRLQP